MKNRTASEHEQVPEPAPWLAYGSEIEMPLEEPRPDSFTVQLNEAILAGEAFGGVAAHLETRDVIVQGKVWLERLGISPLGSWIGAWNYARRAGFWFAACTESCKRNDLGTTEHYSNASQFGGRSQRDLTRAFLGMTRLDRKWLYRFRLKRQLHAQSWRYSFHGAIAVTRTIAALQSPGTIIILPKLHVDTYMKVDLIANAVEHVFAFQIKSNWNLEQSCCRVLASPFPYQEDFRQISAINEFERRYKLSCVPIMLTLGRDHPLAPWDLDATPCLHQRLHSLIDTYR